MTRKPSGGKASKGRRQVPGGRTVTGPQERRRAKAAAAIAAATSDYDEARQELERLIGEMIELSATIAGTPSGGYRPYSASVLLTKMTLSCLTIDKLIPKIASPQSDELWDLGSIATLTRTIAENYFLLHWLCVETEDEALFELRISLLRIVDNRARYRMLYEVEGEAEPADFLASQKTHADRLATMELWHQIDPRRQKELLKGKNMPFIHDDVVEKLDLDRKTFRSHYRYLSSFVHTGTISFFRVEQQRRGDGDYNDYERDAILVCMMLLIMIVTATVDDMRKIHSGSER